MIKKIIATLFLIFAILPFTAACSSDAPKSTSADGTWTEVGFSAEIHNQQIEMIMIADDIRGLYWKGTFPTDGDLTDGTKVTSVADTDALDASMLGSTAETQTFTYEDGELNFEFTILGTTRTVHLEKE